LNPFFVQEDEDFPGRYRLAFKPGKGV
jgi:hypothetical protein